MAASAGDELLGAMHLAEGIVHGEIIVRAPHFTGNFRNSIQPDKPIRIGPEIIGRVGTSAPYALPLETGSKKHWPPMGPIIFWVRRKLAGKGSMMQLNARDLARIRKRDISNAASRGYASARRPTTAKEFQERAIRSTAFLIARKISRVGTKAHWMFKQGFAASRDDAIQVFISARDKIIAR